MSIQYKETVRKACGVLLLTTVAVFASAKDAIDSLQLIKESLEKEIQKTNNDISRTDSLRELEGQRFTLLKSRFTKDVEKRNEELVRLSEELKNLKRDIGGQVNQQQRIENKIKNTKSYKEFLLVKLGVLCEEVELLIEQSLPEKKGMRRERVAVLKRDLESKNASPQEGFARLRSILTEEIRFGDEVSVTNTSVVRLDGEVINARVLRIGNQWMVYTDEDETKYGVLSRSIKDNKYVYTWSEELSFAEREMIRTAIDVKQAKKAPTIVNLPLSLSIDSQGGK